MAKKKNKLKKALKTLIPLLGIGAVMAGRGRKNLIPGSNTMDDIVPTPMNMDEMISIEGAKPIIPGDISNFTFAAKGGRMGYGKGGKVARGCGKIMAGRSKKTKYI